MGGIAGMFGLAGGQSGTGVEAPQQAEIQKPVMPAQLDESFESNKQALAQQQALLQALQGAGGIQNQSQVYGQLQNIAAGQGPNPAQAMLQNATGQNVANQASLMAGQRGANANVGLMGRQIAQQGAATQQQAAGQAALMQAQQSLNAINSAGGIANQQVANQMAGTNAYTGAQQSMYGNLANALAGQNTANVSSQSSVNAANAGLANTQLQGQQGVVGGLMNAVAGGAGMAGGAPAAHGGQVGYADGGAIGPQSAFGNFVTSVQPAGSPPMVSPSFSQSNPGADALREGFSAMKPKPPSAQNPNARPTGAGGMMSGAAMKSGGLVDVVVSPGEKIVPPEKVQQAANGSVVASKVPGQAKVSGDSYANDTVPVRLPPGSVVIPRTKAGDNKDAAAFVRAVLAKRGRK